MSAEGSAPTAFPVGFRRFHRRRFLDYQLNRAHALGHADADELHEAARRVRSGTDCVRVFGALSRQAAAEAPAPARDELPAHRRALHAADVSGEGAHLPPVPRPVRRRLRRPRLRAPRGPLRRSGAPGVPAPRRRRCRPRGGPPARGLRLADRGVRGRVGADRRRWLRRRRLRGSRPRRCAGTRRAPLRPRLGEAGGRGARLVRDPLRRPHRHLHGRVLGAPGCGQGAAGPAGRELAAGVRLVAARPGPAAAGHAAHAAAAGAHDVERPGADPPRADAPTGRRPGAVHLRRLRGGRRGRLVPRDERRPPRQRSGHPGRAAALRRERRLPTARAHPGAGAGR
jgi:hypothetical protein